MMKPLWLNLKISTIKRKQDITERFEDKVLKIRSGDDLLTKCNENG